MPASGADGRFPSKLKDYPVKLEIFEGPLDLLLYLIKKEELDISTVSIAKITEQYLEYLALMRMLDLEIAGEFLVVAATLLQIKSRSLLPPDEQPQPDEEELDPTLELIGRLKEYQRFKEAASQLARLETERGLWIPRIGSETAPEAPPDARGFEANLFDLISAFAKVLKEIPKETFFEVVVGEVTVEEKVHELLHRLVEQAALRFTELFRPPWRKVDVIATFLAVLELMRLKEIVVRQSEQFGEIEIVRNPANIQPVQA